LVSPPPAPPLITHAPTDVHFILPDRVIERFFSFNHPSPEFRIIDDPIDPPSTVDHVASNQPSTYHFDTMSIHTTDSIQPTTTVDNPVVDSSTDLDPAIARINDQFSSTENILDHAFIDLISNNKVDVVLPSHSIIDSDDGQHFVTPPTMNQKQAPQFMDPQYKLSRVSHLCPSVAPVDLPTILCDCPAYNMHYSQLQLFRLLPPSTITTTMIPIHSFLHSIIPALQVPLHPTTTSNTNRGIRNRRRKRGIEIVQKY
jgi:hypothetical protein